MKLKDKIITIVGGGGLLGSQLVKIVKDNGGKVLVIDNLSMETWKNGNIDCDYYLSVDITNTTEVKSAINKIEKNFGTIDGLVNAAYPKNKNYGNHFYHVQLDDFNDNLNLHMGGYFLICQKFSELMKKNNGGVIINIASIYGIIAPKFNIYSGTKMTMPVEYAIIKSGIITLTKYLAKYLKGSNIRLNSISPGGVYDGQSEKFVNNYNNECLGRGMLQKDDLNVVVVFLLSEDSAFINGQNIIVDDGFSL